MIYVIYKHQNDSGQRDSKKGAAFILFYFFFKFIILNLLFLLFIFGWGGFNLGHKDAGRKFSFFLLSLIRCCCSDKKYDKLLLPPLSLRANSFVVSKVMHVFKDKG